MIVEGVQFAKPGATVKPEEVQSAAPEGAAAPAAGSGSNPCAHSELGRNGAVVNFFIDRPIFAWVIAIVIMLAGGLAVVTLPVAQYPSIAPPAISIAVTYPGRFGGDGAEHGHAGDRAADERPRSPPVLLLGE